MEKQQDKFECLDSPLGRILFALGVEVVNCGIAKDKERLGLVHNAYQSLQALWPDNVQQIYAATQEKAQEEGYDLKPDGKIFKDGKEVKPPEVEIEEALKKKDVEIPKMKVEMVSKKDANGKKD